MEVVVARQTVMFIEACAFGFVLGLCFEPLRILRLMIKMGAVAIFFQDILYCVFCAVCMFLFFLTVNEGELRIFLLAGIVIGVVVYFLTLGSIIAKASKAIATLIRRFLRFLSRIFVRPATAAYGKVNRKMHAIIIKVEESNKKILNNVNYRLKQQRILLYNLIHTTTRQHVVKTDNKGTAVYENKRHRSKKESNSPRI